MKRILLSALLVAWFSAVPQIAVGAGVEVVHLYRAVAPVDSQDVAERRRALKDALFMVLVKVSGQPAETLRERLDGAIDDPVGYVQQYRYESLPRSAPTSGKALRTLGLDVEFDKDAVDRLLRNAGLPVWGRVRPATLVWLAMEAGSSRRLATPSDRPGLWRALEARARERGLPLVIPLFDLEDQAGLDAADVWGGFSEAILEASRRYGADGVLTGRLYRDASGLDVSAWILLRDGAERAWRFRDGDHKAQAGRAVDRLAQWLARDFAVPRKAGPRGHMDMHVSGLETVDDYGRLMAYLEGLDAVEKASPRVLDGTDMTVRINATVAREQLLQTLGLGQVLRPLPAGDGDLWFELAR
ncbi:MAG: DUF2066 domain-containing protein [Gammaproteobacteria bacterium]|nr:DUF2066 domain-containing protein [Gammaproteobacteria bacterium]